jgi:hypothetical protein
LRQLGISSPCNDVKASEGEDACREIAAAIRLVAVSRTGMIGRMSTPQSGIFALGTASHAYLEFDISRGRAGRDLVGAISSLREPRTTMGGVNLVAGFRPEV